MKRFILLIILLLGLTAFYFKGELLNKFFPDKQLINSEIQHIESKTSDVFEKLNKTTKNDTQDNNEPINLDLTNLPGSKTLVNDYHIFQTFNNCGPASLSMALSYYGINVDQKTLGQSLRPYQNPRGDNDDKSVTLPELGKKAKEYGLVPLHRPNGTLMLIRRFIAAEIPVITRTWLKENEDIGHYRVIKGYDINAETIVQDDSLQGKNIIFSMEEFDIIWKKFNYEYLVLVPMDKMELAKEILGEDYDERTAWQNAVKLSESVLKEDPDDVYARFNLAVAYYNLGEYQKTVNEYEKVATKLSFRTLWYQIEPILAYYELGQYDKVFQITDSVLTNHNRAFSELYLIRGDIYYKQGNMEKAKEEYEKAVYYNKSLEVAQEALNKVK
jgi:tetratricopeptide (TPR) repeat protein